MLAWRDLRSNGRMRFSWSDKLIKLVEMALEMTEENECAIFKLGERVPIRGTAAVAKTVAGPKRKRAAKADETESPAAV